MPLYQQVAVALRRRIEDGHWRLKQQISTLEELEREFKVARVTVRQAVDLLEQEGLVERKQGKGTFVIATPKETRWLKLELNNAAATLAEGVGVPRALPMTSLVPPIDLERAVQSQASVPPKSAEEGYAFGRVVQTRGGRPFALASVHVAKRLEGLVDLHEPMAAFQSLMAEGPIAEGPADGGLKSRAGVAGAGQRFIIATADLLSAETLKVPLSSPTAEAIVTLSDAEGIILAQAKVIYRGDTVCFDLDLTG
ncbi:MAG: GntR family transcriptional regulator [Magnetovibrionaceae bacterium]